MRTFMAVTKVAATILAATLLLTPATADVQKKKSNAFSAWSRSGEHGMQFKNDFGKWIPFTMRTHGDGTVSGAMPPGTFNGVGEGLVLRAGVTGNPGGKLVLNVNPKNYQKVTGTFTKAGKGKRRETHRVRGFIVPNTFDVLDSNCVVSVGYQKRWDRKGVRLGQKIEFNILVRNEGPDVIFDGRTLIDLEEVVFGPGTPDLDFQVFAFQTNKRVSHDFSAVKPPGIVETYNVGLLSSPRKKAKLTVKLRVGQGAIQAGRFRVDVKYRTEDRARTLGTFRIDLPLAE